MPVAEGVLPTRTPKPPAPKPHEVLPALNVGHSRRILIAKIVAAVCLGFGVHRSHLLSKKRGRIEKKRGMARNALAILIDDLIPLEDRETRAMIACQVRMSYAAMDYCRKRGRFMCGVDKTFRDKVSAIILSLQD